MKFKNIKGITIIELLVAIGILAIIMATIISAYSVGSKLFTSEMAKSDIYHEANKAIKQIGNDLRNCRQITSAESTRITFWIDSNGNGSLEANEMITYAWNGIEGANLVRTQPDNFTIVKNVNNFSLTYNSPSGEEISVITISLFLKRDKEASTLESSVYLRNL